MWKLQGRFISKMQIKTNLNIFGQSTNCVLNFQGQDFWKHYYLSSFLTHLWLFFFSSATQLYIIITYIVFLSIYTAQQYSAQYSWPQKFLDFVIVSFFRNPQMRWNFFRQGIARKTKSPPFSEKRSERSVPKLTDWDFGIPPLQTTFLVKTALRTLMEPTR